MVSKREAGSRRHVTKKYLLHDFIELAVVIHPKGNDLIADGDADKKEDDDGSGFAEVLKFNFRFFVVEGVEAGEGGVELAADFAGGIGTAEGWRENAVFLDGFTGHYTGLNVGNGRIDRFENCG